MHQKVIVLPIFHIKPTKTDFDCREAWPRPRPREYRPRDRGFSPSMEPTAKRMRHDYFGGGDSYYNHYNPYHAAAHRYDASHLVFYNFFILVPHLEFLLVVFTLISMYLKH